MFNNCRRPARPKSLRSILKIISLTLTFLKILPDSERDDGQRVTCWNSSAWDWPPMTFFSLVPSSFFRYLRATFLASQERRRLRRTNRRNKRNRRTRKRRDFQSQLWIRIRIVQNCSADKLCKNLTDNISEGFRDNERARPVESGRNGSCRATNFAWTKIQNLVKTLKVFRLNPHLVKFHPSSTTELDRTQARSQGRRWRRRPKAASQCLRCRVRCFCSRRMFRVS